jgi:hypothetical protein
MSENRAYRTTLGFTAFSSGYWQVSAIGGALLFLAFPFARRGNGPYRMQDARCDPLK